MNYRRIGRFAFAAAGVAAAGAGLWWLREKKTEKPAFAIFETDGEFELRDYPPLLTAETVQVGTRDRALGNGFGVLADYIFANGREGPEIAMTAPVIAEGVDAAHWRVRFVMPAAFGRDTLPAPTPGVEIASLPARRVAAIRFAGNADDAILARKETALAEALAARGLASAARSSTHSTIRPSCPARCGTTRFWREVAIG